MSSFFIGGVYHLKMVGLLSVALSSPPSFLSLSGSGSGSGSNSCGDGGGNDVNDNNNNSNTDNNNSDKMMMMIVIILIIHHLTLDLLGIEFHHFSIYGIFGLITWIMSLKS
jgi:hypothetical protein